MMATWWQQLLLVMTGGAVGAAGRFALSGWFTRHAGSALPWGTLAANLIGAFLAGFLMVWLEARGPSALYWRALLIVGLIGGLTTFSAVMIEALLLGRSSRLLDLGGYLALTLAGGFALVWLGARLAHAMRGPIEWP
jgi:CrcB protein